MTFRRRGGSRRYPPRPLVGVGGVVFTASGDVVLVKRGQPPLAGEWSLPGGLVEVGEPLRVAVARELVEETGLVVDVGPVVDVIERILPDTRGRIQYHYVLVDYLCRVRRGVLRAGTDAEAAVFANPNALGPYTLNDETRRVIAAAVRMRLAQERYRRRNGVQSGARIPGEDPDDGPDVVSRTRVGARHRTRAEREPAQAPARRRGRRPRLRTRRRRG